MKRWHTLAIGLAISAVALYLVFRQADLEEVGSAFLEARYGYVAIAAVLEIGILYLRGLRWQVLLRGRITAIDGTWLFSIGFLFNNILPARLGEIARAVLAGRRPGMQFASALSSIVVERLFDVIALAILIGIVLLGIDELPAWASSAGLAMGIGAFLAVGILAITVRYPDGALSFGTRVLSLVPGIGDEKAKSLLETFVDGLSGVASLRVFALGLFYSVIAWLGSGVLGWVMMLAFWDNVPLIDGMASVAAAGLGIAVPGAPSGIGPFHAAIYAFMTSIGYDPNTTRSFAIMMHGFSFLATSAVGAIGLIREGMSFGQVLAAAESAQATTNREANVEARPS